ncbi:MAG: hypothetical protein LBQ45_02770 [Mycoplasmataceae bacterium]|jgi:hypothetical protein|nr:hypothetical protein [Mycoplasmataceae bacterium]
MVDTNYVAKPTYKFVERKTEKKQSPWVKKQINKYAKNYSSINKYIRTTWFRRAVIAFVLLGVLAIFSISLILWEFDDDSFGPTLSLVFAGLAILLLIGILFYAIYTTLFFKNGLDVAKNTSEYKLLTKKYKNVQTLKPLSKKKIKTLYKMSVISKELYEAAGK